MRHHPSTVATPSSRHTDATPCDMRHPIPATARLVPPAPRRLGRYLLVVLLAVGGSLIPRAVEAGCGCAKPPPAPAQVRPNVAYAGTPVTLFGAALQANQPYTVTFTSGITGQTVSLQASGEDRRDLADGVSKVQVTVMLPSLPLGPTRITVTLPEQADPDIVIDDASFTVAPVPIAVPSAYGHWHYPQYQAAVGRDGVVYIALDVTGVTKPSVIDAQAMGYPLRFTNADVVFHNAQGFLMQTLVGGDAEPIPGMFVFPESNPATSRNSDKLHYSRHEFSTYFLQHQERQPHAVDPTDPNWHIDGSRHVDHDHLILGIAAKLPDGTTPAPGATPAFDLTTTTSSLFHQGLVGAASVTMKNASSIDGYDPVTAAITRTGDVFSNGPITLTDVAVVKGGATGARFSVASTANITGRMIVGTPTSFMQIQVPAGIPTLGSIALDERMSQSIVGPGSFLVSNLSIGGNATLSIDNSAGPVTLYVTGSVTMKGNSRLLVADRDPEKFAIYVASDSQVSFAGSSDFYGVLYAPTSPVTIGGAGEWFGAFVGNTLLTSGVARIHYDSALEGE
jgi:hypothetical protein